MDCLGMDLHQKFSELCVIDDAGEVVERATISTTEKALRRWFKRDTMRIAVEASSVSPWVDKLLRELGHEVSVVNLSYPIVVERHSSNVDRQTAAAPSRSVQPPRGANWVYARDGIGRNDPDGTSSNASD